jgi:hypothetical protein
MHANYIKYLQLLRVNAVKKALQDDACPKHMHENAISYIFKRNMHDLARAESCKYSRVIFLLIHARNRTRM